MIKLIFTCIIIIKIINIFYLTYKNCNYHNYLEGYIYILIYSIDDKNFFSYLKHFY